MIPRTGATHKGVRTKSWTVKGGRIGVHMYSKENVELFLLAREDWKNISPETFMAELDAYLTYYDEGRIKRSLG